MAILNLLELKKPLLTRSREGREEIQPQKAASRNDATTQRYKPGASPILTIYRLGRFQFFIEFRGVVASSRE
jgi:hypothetical protein